MPPLFLSRVRLLSHCVISAIPGMHDQTDINVRVLISFEYGGSMPGISPAVLQTAASVTFFS
ncbi:hypothetical protein SXCC_04561 [Gluconacetobacter sp. SXCC-1]|nr:hypothetical protein SXCC_04561 [Gluconacetobacter sp. SXCC-1]